MESSGWKDRKEGEGGEERNGRRKYRGNEKEEERIWE